MSFKVQRIEDVIAESATSKTNTLPTAISSRANAFILQPGHLPTCGAGRFDAGSNPVSWEDNGASAELSSTSQIVFRRGNPNVFNNLRVGCWLIEYTGPSGGPNEFIVRNGGVPLEVNIQPGDLEAVSSVISDIVDEDKVVPFGTWDTDRGSANPREAFALPLLVNESGGFKIRAARDLAPSSEYTRGFVHAVEFTGSNWKVQKVSLTLANGADANQDFDISTLGLTDVASLTSTFIYVQYKAKQSQPADNTIYVWMPDTGTIRVRRELDSGSNPVLEVWLIENPAMIVQHLGVPDGVVDWTGDGAEPQEEILSINSTDINTSFATGRAGCVSATSGSIQSLAVEFLFNTPPGNNIVTELIARRRETLSGNTEFVVQVVKLPSARITGVSSILNGGTFTITGEGFEPGGTAPTVEIDGVAQTVTDSTDTSIECTFVRGALKYGGHTLEVTTSNGNVMTFDVDVNPQTGWDYVDLATPAPNPLERITAVPDLVAGDQLAWGNVTNGTLDDVTVFSDASFEAAEPVKSFKVEVNDGTGWGATATQTLGVGGKPFVNCVPITSFVNQGVVS